MEENLELELTHPYYDVVVIGGGAAGLMAAGTAARTGKKVLLLEKMEKPARKVRITGKGRCNLTNARPVEEFAENVRTNGEWLHVAMSEFTNRATMRFFERMGVKLVTERGERVFPASGKAADIANALEFYCRDHEVDIQCHSRVTEILISDGKVYGVNFHLPSTLSENTLHFLQFCFRKDRQCLCCRICIFQKVLPWPCRIPPWSYGSQDDLL